MYRKLRDDEGFIIRHFAGIVCYQVVHHHLHFPSAWEGADQCHC